MTIADSRTGANAAAPFDLDFDRRGGARLTREIAFPDDFGPRDFGGVKRRRNWSRRMSDNIAFALLAYTGLQIFVTMRALETAGASLLPFLALIILVVAIIPLCRRFERRWNRLSPHRAGDPALARRFHRDQAVLWALAIGLPFAIAGLFRLLAVLFS